MFFIFLYFFRSVAVRNSQNFKDLENVSPPLSLCFGLIDDVKDLLFHHLLLIARHYIYTCRLGNKLPKLQAPVVQTLDSAIHRINYYPADSVIDFRNTYWLDSDLSGG